MKRTAKRRQRTPADYAVILRRLAAGVVSDQEIDDVARQLAAADGPAARGAVAMDFLRFVTGRLAQATRRTRLRSAAANPNQN